MPRSENNPWLHRFAVFTALTTLCLIGVGGLVTSHGAGMAVPDWPTTYGYNMFFFPISQWIGGIFYEHTHRLVASFVGLLTTILAVWLWLKDSRSWMRWLGIAAFVGVVFQGVLGGLRVTLFKDQIGIFHAILAQLFLILVSAIALFTSKFWHNLGADFPQTAPAGLKKFSILATAMIFLQLTLGATMRHQHAGLAVPDFPLIQRGQAWPPTDEESLARLNARRVDHRDFKPVTAFQVHLHMTHRIGAILALLAVTWTAIKAKRELGRASSLTRLAWAWHGLLWVQFALGVATVLSNKAADFATAHVVCGALSLVCGALLCLVLYRRADARVLPGSAQFSTAQISGSALAKSGAAANAAQSF